MLTRQRIGADGSTTALPTTSALSLPRRYTANLPPACHPRTPSGRSCCSAPRNRDGWGVGLTILTALANLLPVLPEEETYLALFHGARSVAADCDGQAPRHERAPLASRLDLATVNRWLRRWTAVRHREAAERTVLTAIASGAAPAGSPISCLRLRQIAPSPTADTHSTSSIRRSSAST